MSDIRPNEVPDPVENKGDKPPESTPKPGGDGSIFDLGSQWATAARDTLYAAYESAASVVAPVVKPGELPETINFADKPILPVEKSATTELVRPTADRPSTGSDTGFFSRTVESLSTFLQSGFREGERTADPYERGVRRDPFEAASKSDPFFRGFAFGDIGGTSLRGKLDSRSDLLKNDSFNFDGLLPDFFTSKSDSKAGSAKFITNLGLDKIGSSLSSFFFSSKDTGPPLKDDTPGTAAEKGSSIIGDAISGIKRVGSLVIEGAEDLLDIFSKSSDQTTKTTATERTLKRNPDGSTTLEMQTPENGRLRVDTTKDSIHVESDTHGTVDRSKGKGPQDVSVQTTDGRHFHQDKEGDRQVSSEHSDLKVERKGDKVIINDSSGNQVAEFGSEGDAKRFLDNGEISFTKPGETVEQAAERIKAEQGEENWNHNNHIITDGKGNVLTVDEHGNSLRRHPNGTIEMHYQKTGEDGQTSHVDVRLARRNGRTVVSIKGEDGDYHETDAMTSRQVREQLAGSDLCWQDDRLCRRHRHQRPGAQGPGDQGHHDEEHPEAAAQRRPGAQPGAESPAAPAAPVPVMDDNGVVQVNPTTTIDSATGEVKVKQGDNEISVQANPETGQVVLSESESGRTMTQDQQGRVVIQGRDEQDRISFDPTTKVLDAFGIEMSERGTKIRNTDGSSTQIDQSGNFEFFDRLNRSLLRAFDNAVSTYDGTEIAEDNSFYDAIEEALEEQERIHARNEALAEAYAAMSFASSVIGSTTGVLSDGAFAAQEAGIYEAIAHCLAHGVDPPGELFAALANLQGAKPKFLQQRELQGKLYAAFGTVNDSLLAGARRSGSTDPAYQIAYASRYWTGKDLPNQTF